MLLQLVEHPVPLQATPDGVVLVAGTRVPIETVIGAYWNGATPEEIVLRYPSLDLGDVYHLVSYYLAHRRELDAYFAEASRHATEVRAENEVRFNSTGIRERLLARRVAKEHSEEPAGAGSPGVEPE